MACNTLLWPAVHMHGIIYAMYYTGRSCSTHSCITQVWPTVHIHGIYVMYYTGLACSTRSCIECMTRTQPAVHMYGISSNICAGYAKEPGVHET